MAGIVIEEGKIDFFGNERKYEVLDDARVREAFIGKMEIPEHFITYTPGDKKAQTLGEVQISSEVPTLYRGPMVHHELYEFEVVPSITDNIGEGHECLAALEDELRIVDSIPEINRAEYIKFRRGVFRSLLGYLQQKGSESDPRGFTPRVQKSLARLEELARGA